ncbi:PfkB family carbohydrate kinase [Acidiphilium sp.]|uniref:PfkB family carbohydrate kinase n=1 Tax=Acidiphilium sp. TaxID=527 RepID=UPI003D06FAEC
MQLPWHNSSRVRFVVVGRVGMDLYADPPETRIDHAERYVAAVGGSAGNIAVALARQGIAAELVTCVSNDAIGRFCLAELFRYGVDTRHVSLIDDGYRTSLAITETVKQDCQTVFYRNRPADLALTEANIRDIDLSDVAALVVTGTAFAAEPSRSAVNVAMRRARAAGAHVILDIDYRSASWATYEEAAQICRDAALSADIVVGNDTEFGLLAGSQLLGTKFAEDLVKRGALFTIYKQGADGSITYTGETSFKTPIFPVAALKPTGAGDGFMAGLLAGLAQGEELKIAVRRGSATAALIVAGIGCAPASPDRATVMRLIESF